MSLGEHNISMETKSEWVTVICKPAEEDDEFGKLFEAGIPLGDIAWKIHGEIIPPHPDTGYWEMFSSPISQLGIPHDLLKKHGLLEY